MNADKITGLNKIAVLPLSVCLLKLPQQVSGSAAKNGEVEKINQHLAEGVDIDTPDPQNGLTPLAWAAVADKVKVVHHLLKIR